MSKVESKNNKAQHADDESLFEGRDANYMDIDRMVNEGLGGGYVTLHNGLIEESTTDTMEPESDPRKE